MSYLFESNRLGFRKLQDTDLDFLFQLDSDPEVIRYVDGRHPKTIDEVRATLTRVMAKYAEWGAFGVWVAEVKAASDPIGWFALKPLPGFPDIELGYRLLRKNWNHGFATEGGRRLVDLGFDHLGLREIAAITDPDNAASQKVLMKLGFTHDGKRSYQSPVSDKVEQVDFFKLKKTSR